MTCHVVAYDEEIALSLSLSKRVEPPFDKLRVSASSAR